ncbi:MAG TPA: patatin-like phospholipase family protein [Roseiflexaceae bacterium]|jgi:NTE family protein
MTHHGAAAVLVCLALLAGCAAKGPPKAEPQKADEEQSEASPAVPVPVPEIKIPAPRIALVLGGGAAKGFAHIGVIKALEAQGIQPEIIVGTSAGSLVGVLYAAGNDGFALQRIALDLNESMFSDYSLPDRGFLKGEALQQFVNKVVQNRPLEKLNRTVAVVATDLQSGEAVAFQRGDTGMAVRASSAVPGVFQPVRINGRDYVDGGLVSPVPVKFARRLGADIVIASDISAKPSLRPIEGTVDILLQTFTIMGNTIASEELSGADVIIKPDIAKLNSTDFQSRHLAILEGEQAGQAAIAQLRQKLADREVRLRGGLAQQTPAVSPGQSTAITAPR